MGIIGCELLENLPSFSNTTIKNDWFNGTSQLYIQLNVLMFFNCKRDLPWLLSNCPSFFLFVFECKVSIKSKCRTYIWPRDNPHEEHAWVIGARQVPQFFCFGFSFFLFSFFHYFNMAIKFMKIQDIIDILSSLAISNF